MKKFTTEEIRDLLNQVYREKISFSEMVEIMNERVSKANELKFKDGDFVAGFGCVFILHTQIDEYSAQYHVLYAKTNWNIYYYRTYSQLSNTHKLRPATEAEKQELLDALAKKGKKWNAEKLCIENMQGHKFKVGDKVRIKQGVSSKTHDSIKPFFTYLMDKLIGKELTVEYCNNSEVVICDGYSFLKEWLEPYEELKRGDLAIFWDKVKRHAIITFYERSDEDEACLRHKDIAGSGWENAVKFESKEQFKRLIEREI